MRIIKSLQLLACCACILFSSQLFAQNGWETCGATAGTLSGTTVDVLDNATTPAAVFVVTPGPIGTVPTTEFLVILQDSMANDTLGNAIISTSLDGSVTPATLGLSAGDTFSVVSFSYDIQQIKLAVEGLLMNSVPFLGSCCGILDSQAPFPGICDSLNAAGIMDSSDINNINDLLTFLSAFNGGGSVSLSGLNTVLVGINDQISTLSAIGCTNGVGEICYAADSVVSSHDRYAVTSSTSLFDVANEATLQLAVNPNPFTDYISTNVLVKTDGTHTIRVLDAMGKTVHHQVKELNSGAQTIGLNLGNLPAGLYYLQVTDNKNVATKKIVKR
jgi:hypothetical protein